MKDEKNSNRPIQASPLTRAPVLGGLCLGAAEDHSNSTDWAIAQLMTGGKRVGNSDQRASSLFNSNCAKANAAHDFPIKQSFWYCFIDCHSVCLSDQPACWNLLLVFVEC